MKTSQEPEIAAQKRSKLDYVILDRENYENDLKDFSFTFIELPKFAVIQAATHLSIKELETLKINPQKI